MTGKSIVNSKWEKKKQKDKERKKERASLSYSNRGDKRAPLQTDRRKSETIILLIEKAKKYMKIKKREKEQATTDYKKYKYGSNSRNQRRVKW